MKTRMFYLAQPNEGPITEQDAAEETEVWRGDDTAKAGQFVRGDGASAFAVLRRTVGGGECV
jgi:hypothetical protein